ncbi:rhomboid family intramembrane serine protease [Desulfocapsa sulfexigens]|uniref:rhomboid family intramembrane serine protease n=1 Tax=Desulfocapsa sulfexigens TaxID=65555 RepID=UPI00034882C4|nr:rhomboid family intramembrane serine protease [Desulfocapsa sulfexigens]
MVFATDDRHEALSCSLALSAVGISHQYTETPKSLILSVDAKDAAKADMQLKAYLNENKNWPSRPVATTDDFIPLFQPPTLLLIGSLMLLYTVTGPWSGSSLWFTYGSGDAKAIIENHQYFRLLTALTLHADAVHLLGNCLFGGFLFHFFCKLTGNGLGLFSMLLTATIANYINVALHGSNHLFVGFSTAVFAIIGMLAMISRSHRITKRYLQILPFMAGAALLAMIGSSGERTDLGAHFFGLCCGLAFGWLLCRPAVLRLRHSIPLQTILFTISITSIFIAWSSAWK